MTLDQSVQLSRQAEARKLQRTVVRGGDTKLNTTTVEMIKRGQRSTGKHSAATPKHHAGKCNWCGQLQHDRKVCPARQAICHNCQKPSHFSSVCRSSPQIKPRGKSHVHSVGDIFLCEIDDQGNCWAADITVNGHPTRFKLDTGASVSVLSDKTPWLNNCQLDRHPIKLREPGGIPLPVIGALKVTIRYQNREIVETVYVLRNQPTSLLSKAACVSLKIISRVDEFFFFDLTRLPPRESTLDGRWTRKPFGLSRVQPIYLSIPCPS